MCLRGSTPETFCVEDGLVVAADGRKCDISTEKLVLLRSRGVARNTVSEIQELVA